MTVIVTGGGEGVGQAVLRALRLSSLPWHTIGCDVDPWTAGLYACEQGYVILPAHEPTYINRILEVLAREPARILILSSDPELLALSAARSRFLSAGVLPLVSSTETVSLCRDRLATHHFFHHRGLPFARTAPACEGYPNRFCAGMRTLASLSKWLIMGSGIRC